MRNRLTEAGPVESAFLSRHMAARVAAPLQAFARLRLEAEGQDVLEEAVEELEGG